MKNDRKTMRHELILITFGVVLYALLMKLGSLKLGLDSLLRSLSPIILGLGFTLILNVPMRGFARLFERLDKKGRMTERVRNGLALALTVIVVPLVVVVVMRFIVPQFINAVNTVINLITSNTGRISELAASIGLDPELVTTKLRELSTWISGNLASIAGTAVSTVANVFSSVASAFMSLMLAIYLLASKETVKRQIKRVMAAFLPDKITQESCRIAQMFITTFGTYLSRQCLEACILGGILLLGMLIFGIPYAISLACLTAVLALIPFIGAYMSFFTGFMMIVLVDPTKALIFAIWFLVAQQIEGNVIYPHIVGGSVGLPAYLTLMGVFVGGAIAGIPGMVLIIPIISVLYTLLRELVQHKLDKKQRAAEAQPDPAPNEG